MIQKVDADIAVGGRFHADRMAQALVRSGYRVRLWTSLPTSRLIPSGAEVISLLGPEVLFRTARKLGAENWGDIRKSVLFGKTVARRLARETASECFIGWSSFSLETLRLGIHAHKILVRDSFHIQAQLQILEDEYRRLTLRHPDRQRVIERELEEYQLADRILVLSQAARESFIRHGVDAEKIHILPLGVDTTQFSAGGAIEATLPLRCIYFGSLSVRKGVHHLLEAMEALPPGTAHLTLVGGVDSSFLRIFKHYVRHETSDRIRWIPPVAQSELAAILRQHPVFIFPSIEDGFGQTLVQAMACGCVPIATTRCGSADVIVENHNGWKIPPASSEAITDAILRAATAAEHLSEMSERARQTALGCSWEKYRNELLTQLGEFATLSFQPSHQVGATSR